MTSDTSDGKSIQGRYRHHWRYQRRRNDRAYLSDRRDWRHRSNREIGSGQECENGAHHDLLD